MGIIGYVLSVALADTLCTLFLVFKEKLWRQFTLNLQKPILKEIPTNSYLVQITRIHQLTVLSQFQLF